MAAKHIKELGIELGKVAGESGTDIGRKSSNRATMIAKSANVNATKLRKKGLLVMKKLTLSPEENLALLRVSHT